LVHDDAAFALLELLLRLAPRIPVADALQPGDLL
jgi:hypothetical protein